MSEPLSESQLDTIARRMNPGFDQMSNGTRQERRSQILSTLESLESEGWEIARRADRSTFEMAQWMFLRIESNISGSTPKAVIILSLHGAILSAAILQGDRIVREALPSLRNVVGALMVALFLAAVSALWFAFRSVTPRFAKPSGEKPSLLFFGSIARMAKSEFIHVFSSSDRSEFTRDLVEEVHALSGLADWKHNLFVRAFQIVLYVEIPLMAVIALLVVIR